MRLYHLPTLILICIFLESSAKLLFGAPRIKVTLKQGGLLGKVMQTRMNRSVAAFQGIPYAAPPVGNLRFRDPIEHEGWQGMRLAQSEGSDCPQYNQITREFSGSEDCLFLNVYTPDEPIMAVRKLPVMVWIHGGGMTSGSGSVQLAGPEILLDRDIVLVTINYRLGILGLINLGTPELHGNYALRDQIAALKWIQQNIASFGGNPNSVTLFGWSAGAACVHYLLLSPLAKGLYHRAILQSGSAFSDWAFLRDAPEVGVRAAADLGCEANANSDVLECLRKIEPQKLVDAADVVAERERRRDPFAVSIESPTMDSPLITKEPEQLQEADVPIMTGVMTHEGMLNMLIIRPLDVDKEFGENRDFYMPRQLGLVKGTFEFETAWRKILDFYQSLSSDKMEQYLLLATDAEYALGVDQMVRRVAVSPERESPIFYYQFTYEGSLSMVKSRIPTNRTGTAHGDELWYLFSQNVTNWRDVPARDQKFIDQMITVWTNFAKQGNPNPPNSLEWRPLTNGNRNPDSLTTSYMDIGETMLMKNLSINHLRMDFWANLLREYTKSSDELIFSQRFSGNPARPTYRRYG